MLVCTTHHVDQTRLLAAAVAGLARDGDLILLVGDLGAGKTHFTQGFATALGVADRVTSPTFTLANRYVGDIIINHLDAYRVEQIVEAEDLALPELLEGGVTLIEWGDNLTPVLPLDRLEVRIVMGDGDDDRRLELTGVGPEWAARWVDLEAALAPWQVV